MATLGGGMKLKGRNGETGCQVTPAPPTSGSQRDITAPSSHRGAPRAPFCPDPEVPALVGVGCVSCPASRLGSPIYLVPASPRCLRLGSSALLLPRFRADFPESLGMGSARPPVSTLTSTSTSLPEFRADTPISQPTPPPWACSPPPLASCSHSSPGCP